jgi:hypothetical protein
MLFQNELAALNRQPDRKITATDLTEALAFLGQKLQKVRGGGKMML